MRTWITRLFTSVVWKDVKIPNADLSEKLALFKAIILHCYAAKNPQSTYKRYPGEALGHSVAS